MKEHSSLLESTTETINTISQIQYPSFSIFQSISSIQIFYSFYQQFNKYMKTILNEFKNQIIQPLETFYQKQTNIYNDISNEFYNITNSLLENKKELIKAEEQYKKSAYSLNELVTHSLSKHLLYEKEYTYNENKQIYKYKLNEMNKLLGMYNKKYIQLQEKLYLNEESRIFFLNSIFNKFILYLEKHNTRNNILINNIQSILQANNIDDEISSIKKELMFNIQGERFPKEIVREYNINPIITIPYFLQTHNISINNEINSSLTTIKNQLIISSSHIILSTYGKDNQISSFINDLFSPNEITKNQYNTFEAHITQTMSLSKEFIDIFISTCKNTFYEMSNFQNFQYLSNLFHSIIHKIKNNNDTYYSISFAIVYISCRIYYLNKSTQYKIYLCSIISNHKIYQNSTFWKQLIEYKLTLKINEHVKHLLNVNMIDSNIKETNDTSNNKINENKYLLEKNSFSKGINCYSKLTEYKKELLDEYVINEIHLILIEFISYICNWNINNDDAMMLIMEMSIKFQLSKNINNYYVSNIDACCFFTKHKFTNTLNSINTINKIYDIKNKRFNQIKSKFPINHTITQMHNQQKKIIIIAISKYFPLNEIVNIFLLNKFFYKQTHIKILKKYLQENTLPLSHRLQIWKCILGITSIKRKFNYEHIRNEMETSLFYTNNKSVVTIIENDIKRTILNNKVQESKAAIFSILKTIAYIKPTINYCQGMNYICSFIYQLFQNESETFYIMLGLIENTEFHLLFIDNLLNLKKYFFIFHRILQMILPECATALYLSNANGDIFLTPWLITLFTNNSCINNLNNPPLIVLTIWEMFFIKGIRVLISAALAYVKINENSIIQLSNDDMVTFLSKKLAKINFFDNECYHIFIKIFNSVNIPKKIVIDLENEYLFHQKEKIK